MGMQPSGSTKHLLTRRWITISSVVILESFSIFYLFIVPALAATGAIETTLSSIIFSCFLFLQLWMLIAEIAYSSAAYIYGFERRHLFWTRLILRHLTMRRPEFRATISAFGAIAYCLLSYVILIYGFAIAYVFISHIDQRAFNCGHLDLFDSVYFSLITAVTIGYGDIIPLSHLARVFVMIEILATVGYGVFLLSMLGGVLRERDAGSGKTSKMPDCHSEDIDQTG